MGRAPRPRSKRLGSKLLRIRESLGKSQQEMLEELGLADQRFRSAVSGYETGTREPPLTILLLYAELAGVWLDVLVDDRMSLPKKLPADQRKQLK